MPRFMMLLQLPAGSHTPDEPPVEVVEMMNRYNEELSQAGALLALDGLAAPTEAANLIFEAPGDVSVTDGPFAEAKELVGGYWIIQARDREEAIEWGRRAPLGGGVRLEIRRIGELEDYSPEVQEAGRLSVEPPQQTKAS